MIRGPYVYKGIHYAECGSNGHSLSPGDTYYLVTGYGHGPLTLCERHISTELKLDATQKEVVSCQNSACRKLIPAREFARLGECPECGTKRSSQYLDMVANNLLKDTKLVFIKGVLTKVARNGGS